MIKLQARSVVKNGQSLRLTLPKTWTEHLAVNKGTKLIPYWDAVTGDLIIRKEKAE